MSIEIELRDYAGRKITFDELSKKSRRILAKRTVERLWDIVQEGAINIRNNIIVGIRDSPPTGKLYFRGFKKDKKGKAKPIWHRASSPGNYPRTDSGDLVRSIKMDTGVLEVEVGSQITQPPYPLYLEKGTDIMEPRPWLGPSFNKEEKKLKRRMDMVMRRSAADFVRERG